MTSLMHFPIPTIVQVMAADLTVAAGHSVKHKSTSKTRSLFRDVSCIAWPN